jgi:hypothetical protein
MARFARRAGRIANGTGDAVLCAGFAAQRRISGPILGGFVNSRRTSPASFSSLMAERAVTTAQAIKIEKKPPFGTTGNRNLLSGSNHRIRALPGGGDSANPVRYQSGAAIPPRNYSAQFRCWADQTNH